ncbi:MAG: septal ring lytic transglycosylase RlpA family protein [Acidimicrobiales bacterium]
MLAAGVPLAMALALPPALAAEPPAEAPERPASVADLVSRLLQGTWPILVGPTTTTTTVPGGAVAETDPGVEVNLPITVTPDLVPPALVPPTTSPPAVVSAPSTPSPGFTHAQAGVASWYNDRDGRCAHRTAPIGTVVTVTDLADGDSVQCTVTNRGPYASSRIIDLSDESFARLAPLSQGLADVRVEW